MLTSSLLCPLFLLVLVLIAAPRSAYPVRLVGAGRANEGRLEVFYDNMWAGVSLSTYFTPSSITWDWLATTACKELGFARGRAVGGMLYYAPTAGLVTWTTATCNTNKSSIADCAWGGINSMLPHVNLVCTKALSGTCGVSTVMCRCWCECIALQCKSLLVWVAVAWLWLQRQMYARTVKCLAAQPFSLLCMPRLVPHSSLLHAGAPM